MSKNLRVEVGQRECGDFIALGIDRKRPDKQTPLLIISKHAASRWLKRVNDHSDRYVFISMKMLYSSWNDSRIPTREDWKYIRGRIHLPDLADGKWVTFSRRDNTVFILRRQTVTRMITAIRVVCPICFKDRCHHPVDVLSVEDEVNHADVPCG